METAFPDTTKPPAEIRRAVNLFQTFFQGGCCVFREPDFRLAILVGQYKGLGQSIAGGNLSLRFRIVQKFLGSAGNGGVIQVEDADDAPVPDGEVLADVEIPR